MVKVHLTLDTTGQKLANQAGKTIIQRAITISKALGTTMQANKAASIAAQLPSTLLNDRF